MALLLALDTATDRPSLALGSSAAPGDDLLVPTRSDLSREIDRLAAELLRRRRLAVSDLAGVVVADGPGSFTGLRIGIAFAKGLCRAHALPLFTAPSLLGAAFHASGGSGTVVAEYDALRGDVFRAAYRFEKDRIVVLLPPAVVSAGAPVGIPEVHLRVGEGHASAAALLMLAARPGALTAIHDSAAWEPVYGRLAEAEARRRARGGVRVGGSGGADGGFEAR